MNKYDAKMIACVIDHTILKAETTRAQVTEYCRQAKEYKFASVCINPVYVSLAAAELANSGVGVCTVIGFPLGANNSKVKAFEAATAVSEGATEIDMVLNIGALKEGRYDDVEGEISQVVKASAGAPVKVILETCYLSDDEKKLACRLAVKAGASFVKTSTGFGIAGATLEDVRLMKEAVGDKAGVKASGGIRSLDTAIEMIEAGASRLGTSSGIRIMGEMK